MTSRAASRGGARRRGRLARTASLVAATMFLSSGLTVGTVFYSFGVFVSPLGREFGWSLTQINVGVSLAVVIGLANPATGWLLDRVGTRPVMVGSLLLMAAGFGLRPLMSELWHFYALNALMYLGVPGATELPMARLVSMWFPRRRGRMMGIISTGNNVGGLTMVPLGTAVVLASGWQLAYAVFGLLFLAAALLALVWMRDGPRSGRGRRGTGGRDRPRRERLPGLTLREAARTRTFYLLALASLSTGIPPAAILPQLVPHLENEGFAPGTAAAAVSTMAMFALGSKLVFGPLAESITARKALAAASAVLALGTVALVAAGGSAMVWPAIALYGFGMGALGALLPLIVPEAFGLRAFGAIFGTIRLIATASFVGVPLMVGALFDATGSYGLAFLLSAAGLAPGIPALLLARAAWSPGGGDRA